MHTHVTHVHTTGVALRRSGTDCGEGTGVHSLGAQHSAHSISVHEHSTALTAQRSAQHTHKYEAVTRGTHMHTWHKAQTAAHHTSHVNITYTHHKPHT
jgi:hypothetical protein